VCVGATEEWRETHLLWGGAECILLQTAPALRVVERGAKMLYLNSAIRGYPLGLRAGVDPRKPSLIINDAFSQLEFKGAPYPLVAIEVWGCGVPQARYKIISFSLLLLLKLT
jgi:hypothetical protein